MPPAMTMFTLLVDESMAGTSDGRPFAHKRISYIRGVGVMTRMKKLERISQRMLLGLFVCVMVSRHPVGESAFVAEPERTWSVSLPGAGKLGGRSLVRGNAIVASNDGSTLYMTTDDGTLVLVDTSSQTTRAVVEPPIREGSVPECRTGVSLHHDRSGSVRYVVYAITDIPYSVGVSYGSISASSRLNPNDLNSRVMAVNPDGSLRWSYSLKGYVSGTPQIGAMEGGKYVYVSQNIRLNDGSSSSNNTERYRGMITILWDRGSSVELVAQKSFGSRVGPYGPLTVQPMDLGSTQNRDVVIWSESWGEGYVQDGRLYALWSSSNNDDDTHEFQMRTLSKWQYPSVTAPTVSANGRSIWSTYGSAIVSGWSANDNDPNTHIDTILKNGGDPISPTWAVYVQFSERNDTQPIFTSAVVSSDNKFLYLNSAAWKFYCLDAKTGDRIWIDEDSDSSYMVQPKLVEIPGEVPVVYTIESLTGRVRQHNALTGKRNWEMDCSDLTGNDLCDDLVEADFAVSKDNNMLYYGSVFGKISAVRVGTFPTLAPTTPFPTNTPSISSGASPSGTRSDDNSVSTVSGGGGGDDGTLSTKNKNIAPNETNPNAAKIWVPIMTVLALCFFLVVFLKRRKDQKEQSEFSEEEQSVVEISKPIVPTSSLSKPPEDDFMETTEPVEISSPIVPSSSFSKPSQDDFMEKTEPVQQKRSPERHAHRARGGEDHYFTDESIVLSGAGAGLASSPFSQNDSFHDEIDNEAPEKTTWQSIDMDDDVPFDCRPLFCR